MTSTSAQPHLVSEPHPAFTEAQQLLLDALSVDIWSLPEASAKRLAEGLANAEAGMRLSNGDPIAQEAFKAHGRVDAMLDSGGGAEVFVSGPGYELRVSSSGSGAYALSFKDRDGAMLSVSGDGKASSPEASAVRQYTGQALERERDPEVTARWEQDWMLSYLATAEKKLRSANLRTPAGEKLEIVEVYAVSCADNAMAPPKYQDEHTESDHPRSPYDGKPMNVHDIRAKVTWTEQVPLPFKPSETVPVERNADIKVGSVVPETGEPLENHTRVAGEPGLESEGIGPIEWVIDAIDGVGLVKAGMKFVAKEFAEKGAKEGAEAVAHSTDEVEQIVAGIVETDAMQVAHRDMAKHLARGHEGEQGMGFFYNQESGWAFLEGPSGAAGHAASARGFDGVAFKTDGPLEIHILDNKSLKSDRPISGASALTKNLEVNLDNLAARANDKAFDDVPRIAEVRESISAAREAVSTGAPMPSEVHLVVTNSGSTHVTGISEGLQKQGIEFRDIQTPPAGAPDSPGAGFFGFAELPDGADPEGSWFREPPDANTPGNGEDEAQEGD
ncbi:hypothetical protein [Catelliglobosispora koreensis]|uniref:hypothetical protein n=1 Tax=Catelliglobosispora koreensis TaxID=129052 RepID=UPI000366E3F7|nr:hypothetical protein [Catelliglobosispora koreensis]